MEIDSSMLRLLWAATEEMPAYDLLALSDTALIAGLLKHISSRVLLKGEEVCCLYAYIGSKLSLIRDIADGRQSNVNFISSDPPIAIMLGEAV